MERTYTNGMDKDEMIIPAARSRRYFFKGQLLHLGSAAILIPIAWAFAAPNLGNGSYLGLSDLAWFWLAVGLCSATWSAPCSSARSSPTPS